MLRERQVRSSPKPHVMPPTQVPDANSISALAASLLGSPCRFILTTETKSYSGGEYLVYPLESTSGRRICIRIPKETHQHTSFLLEHEADIRRRIDAARIHLFQPLIVADPKADNSLHVPFMALGWADGATLKWSDSNPASEDERRRFLRGVANATLDLLRIQETGVSPEPKPPPFPGLALTSLQERRHPTGSRQRLIARSSAPRPVLFPAAR